MHKMKIKFKLMAGGFPPVAGHGDWIDLRARKSIRFKKGEYWRIPLGVAVQLPEGYEAMLCLRSSTPERYGVIQANAPGIIDEAYCGENDELMLAVVALCTNEIPEGARIAQMRIFPKQNVELEQVEKLWNPDRGGFGSTGR